MTELLSIAHKPLEKALKDKSQSVKKISSGKEDENETGRSEKNLKDKTISEIV